jgi:hypothetical protein
MGKECSRTPCPQTSRIDTVRRISNTLPLP